MHIREATAKERNSEKEEISLKVPLKKLVCWTEFAMRFFSNESTVIIHSLSFVS